MTFRVLHALDHSIPLHSGYTFRTRNILKHQHKMGWYTAHVTSPKQGHSDWHKETVSDLTFYRTQPETSRWSRWPALNQLGIVTALTERLIEVAGIEKPDVIHAHSPALNGIAALRAGKALNLPVVYECRAFWEDAAVDHGTSAEWGPRYIATRAMESRVFRKADAVTTICGGLQEEISGRFGVDSNKITVIPNAVNVDEFNYLDPPHEETQQRLRLQGKKVLGFIGSFYAYEGLPLLIDILPTLVERDPDIRLLLVGGGPQEEEIRKRVRQRKLEDIVIMPGRVPHNEVQLYYSLVDVFVYPRNPIRLTDLVTPLKPLEAMAQGRLVVASDVGGHRELIKDGVTGKLFKAGDKDSLLRAISDLLGSPESWDDYRRAGRNFVESERTWSESVSRYQDVYGKLLASS